MRSETAKTLKIILQREQNLLKTGGLLPIKNHKSKGKILILKIMSWFSKTEDYSISKDEEVSYERGDERVKVSYESETQYGSHNRPSKGNEQGERHETHWNGDGTRESVDIDSDGNPIESTRHRH
jgi:hypothetical protein